jgi:WXXGXW repeat (2 copies)
MKTTIVGHCEASATTRTPSALQSPGGSKLNKALRGTMLCLALGVGAASLPAFAQRVIVRVAPPALQVEEVPAARAGYMWAPGYWRWQNRQHVWARGHWERERRGQRYESPRWEQRGDRYQFAPGRWQRDSNRRGG